MLSEEKIVNYTTLVEAELAINEHLLGGFLFVRHDTTHQKLFFKKNDAPLQPNHKESDA